MDTYAGIVEAGSRRAAALGYPTINIPLTDASVAGIYAARVYVKDSAPYIAAAFADSSRGVLEAHLLDFEDDLYGLEITIELHKKIREAADFESEKVLKEAIESDIAITREYFKN